MMLGNMQKLFWQPQLFAKGYFMGVSDSIVGMDLLCSYVVHSGNDSASSRYGWHSRLYSRCHRDRSDTATSLKL